MTKKETAITLAFITAAYPNWQTGDPETVTNLWAEMLSDLPAAAVHSAVKQHIATSRFAPTIADVRAIASFPAITPGEVWEEAHRLLNSGISPEDTDTAYSKMSDACKHAVLSVGGWYSLSMSPENDQFIQRDFAKAVTVYNASRRGQAALLDIADIPGTTMIGGDDNA